MNSYSPSEQEFIEKLNAFIETNLGNEHFGVSELASELGMSRSNLHKKVKAIANITANQYIRQFRLNRALEMLQQTSATVSEAAHKTGFSSPSYFVKCFHEHYGYSPGKVNHNNNENYDEKKASKSSVKKRIAGFASGFLLVAIAVLLFVVVKPFSFQHKDLEKSIAILPFTNDSPDSTATYINGLMESIINNLQKVEDLDVRSRTSVERYRDTKKSLKEIAKELHVNYIVEGSGLKIGNVVKLTIQLVEANTDIHLLSEEYTKEINEVEDLIDIQAEIALDIVKKIKVKITDSEINEIEKLPTLNMAAYNMYKLGLELYQVAEHSSKISDFSNYVSQNREARKCFEQAVFIDSTFADAYYQLSHYFTDMIYYDVPAILDPRLGISYLDTGYYYTTKTLEFDNNHQNAIQNLMKYYLRKGMKKEADETEKRLLKIAKKDYHLYEFFMDVNREHEGFDDFFKYYYGYQKIKPADMEMPIECERTAFDFLYWAGFPEKARDIAEKLLIRTNDSIGYWHRITLIDYYYKTDQSLKYLLRAYHKDSTQYLTLTRLKALMMMKRNWDDALYYLIKEKNWVKEHENYETFHRMNAIIYLKNGLVKEAEKELNADEKKCLEQIELNLPFAQKYHTHNALAKIYAVKGEKEKALYYFKQQKNMQSFGHQWIEVYKYSPLLDNIRNEPEFQEVVSDVEVKYQKQHLRIEKLLKDLGELD